MQILETKGRKTNKIKREEREDLHTFSDTTKSTDDFAKKYGRFYWKVRTVYKKGTMVLNRKNIGN